MLLCGFHWHSRYSIWISTFVLFDSVCFKAIVCELRDLLWLQNIQNVPDKLICHDNWSIASRLAWMPNVYCILG